MTRFTKLSFVVLALLLSTSSAHAGLPIEDRSHDEVKIIPKTKHYNIFSPGVIYKPFNFSNEKISFHKWKIVIEKTDKKK